MKLIPLLILLPILALSQDRVIGTKTGSTYSFAWDMTKVVQSTLAKDVKSIFSVDTVYIMNDSAMQVVFSDSTTTYSNIVVFQTINNALYTNIGAKGCLNSCYKELGCAKCSKRVTCDCYCVYEMGSCSDKNLAIFKNTSLSEWFNSRILNNTNPE